MLWLEEDADLRHLAKCLKSKTKLGGEILNCIFHFLVYFFSCKTQDIGVEPHLRISKLQ